MLASEHVQLVAQMRWADALVWRSVLRTPEAHASDEMHRRLHHIHLVQHLYLQIWRGEPLRITEHSDFADLRAIHGWAEPFYARAESFVRSLSPDGFQEPVSFPWAEELTETMGVVHPATVGQSLLQVTSHSTYHRGQVCAHLRQLGGEPPLTDFIAWVWQGRPDADPPDPFVPAPGA